MFIRPRIPEPAANPRQTLAELGYAFDSSNGTLLNTTTGERYDFEMYPGDKKRNLELYNKLADSASRHVTSLLTSDDLRMQAIAVPDETLAHTSIFISPGALECSNLAVLCTGHGPRPGVWAWNALVNEGLRAGSLIPYIQALQAQGYGVLVMNPNENIVGADGQPETFNSIEATEKFTEIRSNETPDEHVGYVWSRFIRDNQAVQRVAFVCYNTTGISVTNLLKYDFDRFVRKCVGVAFMDSVHSSFQMTAEQVVWLAHMAKHWETSVEPANEPIENANVGCPTVSSGNDLEMREMTPFLCKDFIVEFLDERFQGGLIDRAEMVAEAREVEIADVEMVDNIQGAGALPGEDDNENSSGWTT
ncbi:hypothetical protein FBU59_003743 [Linderina macrospora]|uniref:Uncharacterized protein n=1 Tax=Linderina macrospora TaxID=4868 RepID=A0ACC1J7H7_9FUNG|nr:hypothetical protein FBU59_003743 [Linderina macrospora]